MIFAHLSYEADRIAATYEALTAQLGVLYVEMLNRSDFGSAGQGRELLFRAGGLARAYLDQVQEALPEILRKIAAEARRDVFADLRSEASETLLPSILEHLSANERYLVEELSAQIKRDVTLVHQTHQRAVLAVLSAARADGVPARQALIQFRLTQPDRIEFAFHDRAARRFSSTKFVRALCRHTLLSVYNETVLMCLAEDGATRAQVMDADGARGQVISIGFDAALPGYLDIRDATFHPNATARLVREDLSVQA